MNEKELKNCSVCKLQKEMASGCHRCKECNADYLKKYREKKKNEEPKPFFHHLFSIYDQEHYRLFKARHHTVPLVHQKKTLEQLETLSGMLADRGITSDAQIRQLFRDAMASKLRTCPRQYPFHFFWQDLREHLPAVMDTKRFADVKQYPWKLWNADSYKANDFADLVYAIHAIEQRDYDAGYYETVLSFFENNLDNLRKKYSGRRIARAIVDAVSWGKDDYYTAKELIATISKQHNFDKFHDMRNDFILDFATVTEDELKCFYDQGNHQKLVMHIGWKNFAKLHNLIHHCSEEESKRYTKTVLFHTIKDYYRDAGLDDNGIVSIVCQFVTLEYGTIGGLYE